MQLSTAWNIKWKQCKTIRLQKYRDWKKKTKSWLNTEYSTEKSKANKKQNKKKQTNKQKEKRKEKKTGVAKKNVLSYWIIYNLWSKWDFGDAIYLYLVESCSIFLSVKVRFENHHYVALGNLEFAVLTFLMRLQNYLLRLLVECARFWYFSSQN